MYYCLLAKWMEKISKVLCIVYLWEELCLLVWINCRTLCIMLLTTFCVLTAISKSHLEMLLSISRLFSFHSQPLFFSLKKFFWSPRYLIFRTFDLPLAFPEHLLLFLSKMCVLSSTQKKKKENSKILPLFPIKNTNLKTKCPTHLKCLVGR